MHLEKNKNNLSPGKKSCTTVLCELMRLKSQEKFLECNQIKLIPDNFIDDDEDFQPSSSGTVSNSNCNSTQFVLNQINEIENIKMDLCKNLKIFRENAQHEVQEMWDIVNSIKDDVFDPVKRSQLSLPSLRERIIAINTHIEQLIAKNSNNLLNLKKEFEEIEKDIKV